MTRDLNTIWHREDHREQRMQEAQRRAAELSGRVQNDGQALALVRGMRNELADRYGVEQPIAAGESKALRILEGVISGTGPIQSIREAYRMVTGDKKMSGRVADADRLAMLEYLTDDSYRLTEAIDSSTFANVLGAAVSRQMLREYAASPMLQAWRSIVRVDSLTNFRTHKRVIIGGYGNLPAVAETAGFQPLTSPAERVYEIALAKRGGTESITMETIVNDDVGAVRKVASELALAALNTLFEMVFDFLKNSPVIYDGQPLFGVGRGNLGSAALSAAGLFGAFRAMRKFSDTDLNRRAYIQPKFIAVPLDLEETAFNILQRNLNLDRTFIQAQGLEVLPVPYWTDVNDWCLVGDPSRHSTIEVSFLGGREEPELMLADNPSEGSFFSNDQVKLKIRHVYGGAVADWRAFYKNVL